MDVFLNNSKISLEHIHLRDLKVLFHTDQFSHLENGLQILSLIEIRNITRVQNVVDILKHLFIDDLGIDEYEVGWLVFTTSLHENFLNIFSPVLHSVTLNNLNLEKFEVCKIGCKS